MSDDRKRILFLCARREIVEQVAPRYRQASVAQKSLLLDNVHKHCIFRARLVCYE